MQFWVPSTILRTEKNTNVILTGFQMVDMTFCGNCICIDYILCNISIIDWKKICWWCSHILWRPWPRFKIKNLSEKMSTCFCLMACHARNGWVLQWLPFGQSEFIYLFFLLHFQSMTSASWYWAGHWNMFLYS